MAQVPEEEDSDCKVPCWKGQLCVREHHGLARDKIPKLVHVKGRYGLARVPTLPSNLNKEYIVSQPE